MFADKEMVAHAGKNIPLDTSNAIVSLARLPEAFHLTGSRFFGYATSKSDWDFAAQYSPELVRKLRDIGFVSCDRGYVRYGDGYTVDVMEHCDVQVQLRSDLGLTLKVRDLLYNELRGELRAAGHEQRREAWRLLYGVVELLSKGGRA